nr:MAG TPA: hypothetical protein [Caudoviricetes sp.]DAK77408.1 MAG TPA: hypothetical protein [Caudoviricetes sp.]
MCKIIYTYKCSKQYVQGSEYISCQGENPWVKHKELVIKQGRYISKINYRYYTVDL